ncbi:MAG: light-harvesting antenna LH1, beta subunit [Gemmatimonadota bacterium]
MADPMARMGAPPGRSLSGLSEDEARGFHRMFITSFLIFVAIAAVAHWAVWQWRPWIPGVSGYQVTAEAPATTPSTTTVATTSTK